MSLWEKEWNKFSMEAIEDMKKYSDKTHEEREWMCYVYEKNGKYYLGGVSYGDESAISVNPETKHAADAVTKGLRKRLWTIHGHPLKNNRIYTGRQYFSSTDICREYVKSRDNNEYIAQFLVYPHQQLDKSGGDTKSQRVLHNRVRTLIFPDTQTIVAAMKESNPNVDPYAITPESGQNRQVTDGSGGSTLQNDAGVDWFEFQEAMGRHGCMGIVDIEGPAGGQTFRADTVSRLNRIGFGGVALIALGLWYINKNKEKLIEVVEGWSAEHL